MAYYKCKKCGYIGEASYELKFERCPVCTKKKKFKSRSVDLALKGFVAPTKSDILPNPQSERELKFCIDTSVRKGQFDRAEKIINHYFSVHKEVRDYSLFAMVINGSDLTLREYLKDKFPDVEDLSREIG